MESVELSYSEYFCVFPGKEVDFLLSHLKTLQYKEEILHLNRFFVLRTNYEHPRAALRHAYG